MKFGDTLSIVAFKQKHNTDRLDVIKNPNTDKLFVTANGKTVAAVSKNYDSTKTDKEFVELITEDTGEIIWCLHNPSSTNRVESL